MLVGYARVSDEKQSLDRQIDALVASGVDKRNIYQEKVTGTISERPQLNEMIKELQPNDVCIVAAIYKRFIRYS